MAAPGESDGRRRGYGRTMCRQPATWEVGREKVIGILIEEKSEGKIRKIPVITTVGYKAVIFG